MSGWVSGLRDPGRVRAMAEEVAALDPGRPVRLMHVCGTHENALCAAGIRDLLPGWLSLVAGPGCPVCVCPASEIDLAVRIASIPGVTLATFGDLVRVPARISLAQARTRGADVRVVYGVADAVALARAMPGRKVVFFAVGFETTACTTAAAIQASPPDNFLVLASHRLVPPALQALLELPGETPEGFLLPGHVITVTGLSAYRDLLSRRPIPMAVGGFEPLDILRAIREILVQIRRGHPDVVNAYSRAVREEGNRAAREAIKAVFEAVDAPWRGIGTIPGSGLRLRPPFRHLDAAEAFGLAPDPSVEDAPTGCRCGEVLLGRQDPEECPFFGSPCVPDDPMGPCMVAQEGTCAARYRHRRA
ncbi:hydrogenase formation protein HypD [Myxococcota bacterium]|nr:hydrogenase formation protein HypD [Myxococcota bacterium]